MVSGMAVSIAWKMSHVPLPSPTLTPPPRPPALLRAATCLANPSLSFPTLLRSWGQKARPFCFRSGFLLRETTSRFPRWRPRGSLLSQRAAACPFPRPSETLLSHVKPRRALGTSLCLAQALTAWGATGDGDGEAGSPGTLNLSRCARLPRRRRCLSCSPRRRMQVTFLPRPQPRSPRLLILTVPDGVQGHVLTASGAERVPRLCHCGAASAEIFCSFNNSVLFLPYVDPRVLHSSQRRVLNRVCNLQIFPPTLPFFGDKFNVVQ